jgi:hypothetical protein
VAGRPVGRLPLATPVPVDEGAVDIEARAVGYQPMIRTVTVRGGQYQKLVLRLDRSVEPGAVALVPTSQSAGSTEPSIAAVATPSDNAAESSPVYKSPWFWGAIGAVVVAGVVTAVLLSGGETTKTGPVVVDRMETF